ncbi:PrsW family intramembrane metalloprotease, partial [Nocardiopsis alba]
MSHARPEPDVPSTVDGRVPRPRPSAREDEEGGPARVGGGPPPPRPPPRTVVTGVVFGRGCRLG